MEVGLADAVLFRRAARLTRRKPSATGASRVLFQVAVIVPSSNGRRVQRRLARPRKDTAGSDIPFRLARTQNSGTKAISHRGLPCGAPSNRKEAVMHGTIGTVNGCGLHFYHRLGEKHSVRGVFAAIGFW
jgi:hypothetical protein